MSGRDHPEVATAASMRLETVRSGPVPERDVVTARSRAITWARAAVTDPTVVYLDTETTGLDRFAEIVEIALIDAFGRVIFETLVRPVAAVPAVASSIHGIVDADLAQAPAWPDIHDLVCDALLDRKIVVYNAAFDRRMIAQSSARHGLVSPTLTWSCAMETYASFRGVEAGRGSFRRHKLEDAARAFGGPVGGHRAAGDALACRAVVVGIANSAH